MRTVHSRCSHCNLEHAITDWPQKPENVLFTCLAKWGGCKQSALVHVPRGHGPFFQDIFVMAEPLTAAQAAHLSREYGHP
jgi:hypothetical protein